MEVQNKSTAIVANISSSPPSPSKVSKKRRISSESWTNKTAQGPLIQGSVLVNPLNHLRKLFNIRKIQISITSVFSLENYFRLPLDEDYSSYKEDIVSAVRKRDINALQKMLDEGRSLQCCNRFGESLFHMACRRSYDDVVQFLIDHGISPKIKDDMGRTPMHDAFWTAKPNFALVKILLSTEPSLLFLSDKRGHTPLDYARRNDWFRWNIFLSENVEFLAKLYSSSNLT